MWNFRPSRLFSTHPAAHQEQAEELKTKGEDALDPGHAILENGSERMSSAQRRTMALGGPDLVEETSLEGFLQIGPNGALAGLEGPER